MNRLMLGFAAATIAAAITHPEWPLRGALPALVMAGIIIAVVNAALARLLAWLERDA